MASFLKIAPLDDDGVQKLRTLEDDLGKHIMAFIPGLEIANLTQDQLAQVRALEDELQVTLLVYET
ncbi:MAG: hypothetical protein H6659_08860 [Ardenticatenaceae bacterium]|nr:hypothetical protein [Anaerolineales bacterium]MCB8983921.1 hypothetical protein [Ardenticatenaceae bacterium]